MGIQETVKPLTQPINGAVVERANGNAPAVQVVNGGEKMPLALTPEAKSQANNDAVAIAKSENEVIVRRSDLTGRKGVIVKGSDGNSYLVAIEPIIKPTMGKVATLDKNGKELAEPKATYNMSAYGRVSLDTGKDRSSRLSASEVGKSPVQYSPPSIYSRATAYEISIANQTGGTTEVSSRDREVLDF